MENRVTSALLMPELEFITSRSSGPGGQNVNKVNTKVTLRFDVNQSRILSEEEKNTVLQKAGTRVTTSGVLVISSQAERSQQLNKEAVIAKLDDVLRRIFRKRKKRKPTKPTKTSREVRIKEKKQRSEKKKWRQNPF